MKQNDRRDEPRAHSGFFHAVGLDWTCWPFDKDCGPPLCWGDRKEDNLGALPTTTTKPNKTMRPPETTTSGQPTIAQWLRVAADCMQALCAVADEAAVFYSELIATSVPLYTYIYTTYY